ncbi:V-type ATPase, D subunit [Rippkaea orientalis PCC 8801]|uniref:V-type ATPase, D subunit n=1 Tax=Rippkaea orientalis (strain PCC 8801 / RF-1) TaxID=41431 RepID=B7JY98_RIPO1|nr:V-type ATP synthase subunit D [Rippkaea orientalis]ACK67200.1 V-type ATPase, D subunit [Rippkaea orientalis PCC 8801]
MSRLSLTKASLTKQKQQLKTFGDILPSLDLKRRQISAERANAREKLAQVQQQRQELETAIAHQLPMLSNYLIDLKDLVKVKAVYLEKENVMGTWLPKIKQIDIQVQEYALLGKPFWVDRVVELLKLALKAEIERQIEQKRVKLLNQAERVITQRFNLFDKVLIPQTKANIKKIEIYLADAERAGVVNAKLAKGKKESTR